MGILSKRTGTATAVARLLIVVSLSCISKSATAAAFAPRQQQHQLRPTTSTTTRSTTNYLVQQQWQKSPTALKDVASVPKDDGSGVSYSERSRPYRRDVFNYDDWVRHRSSSRFTGRLAKLTKSGIVRALAYEVQLLAAVSTFICVFNALAVTGFDDFSGLHHDPLVGAGLPVLSLPAMFFTLSSPALSLLLGRVICRSLSSLQLQWICRYQG